uniref:Uncharacterized protein n=1 Tax=Lepeophtheirus salmonis TaxID=72036 RepID=A0A0K2TNC6_LEPSM
MKRHEQYSFSPPKQSSNCQAYHVDFVFLFFDLSILYLIFINLLYE